MAYTHVHIGAGRFGLGMVVDVCRRAGFQTAVLNRDSQKDHHPTLRRNQGYKIIYDGDQAGAEEIKIPVHYYQNEGDTEAINLLSSPSLILLTTSVTPDGLKSVAPLIARAVKRRKEVGADAVCVLACENLPLNSQKLAEYVQSCLSADTRETYFSNRMVFCNTVVDRVCAEIPEKCDPVEVDAESYFEWIVEQPSIEAEALRRLNDTHADKFKIARNSSEFEAYATRKYWCFNGAHLAAAAYAYNYAFETKQPLIKLSEALEKSEVVGKLKALQEELVFALRCLAREKGVIDAFSEHEIRQYNEGILSRMQTNKEDRFARILKHAEGKVESMQEVLKMLDLHEFLDRVVSRIVQPQREIVSSYNQLLQSARDLWSSYSLVPAATCPRLQLDQALQETVIATERYAKRAFEDAKAHAVRFLRGDSGGW